MPTHWGSRITTSELICLKYWITPKSLKNSAAVKASSSGIEHSLASDSNSFQFTVGTATDPLIFALILFSSNKYDLGISSGMYGRPSAMSMSCAFNSLIPIPFFYLGMFFFPGVITFAELIATCDLMSMLKLRESANLVIFSFTSSMYSEVQDLSSTCVPTRITGTVLPAWAWIDCGISAIFQLLTCYL